jgi:DNA-binding NarL/FixJ family response regulator
MKKALIVEDESGMQSWLLVSLQEAFPGIDCRCAENTAQALACIGSESFDLALIDLGLPDDSGLTVLEALRPYPVLSIVVTIFDDDEHLFPALRAGAQGYLLKDLPREEFIAHMRNIAQGEPPLSPAISRRLLAYFEIPAPPKLETNLTEREREVLILVSKGLILSQVGRMLGISRHTTAGHVKSIYRKLKISSRVEAVVEASRLGLIDL